MEKELFNKTGTTTIALVCKDGVVLTADRRMTMGYMIAGKKFEKISILNEDIALTMAGLVSDAQLLTKIIKAQLRLDTIRRGKKPSTKEVANLVGSLVYGNIRKFSTIPGIVGFMLAGRDDKGYHLYDIGVDGSVSLQDEYYCEGSGSEFAMGVLESGYNKDINVDDGVKLALKALNSALQRDVASGSGYDVVTITKDGAKKVLEKEIKFTL
ncbi:MAG: Proteasome subunit beta [archaeon GW2011_AR20]|nr:MAG: Proteasome subunit beta [archaeon GW2011_AR20]MBS3160792.1 proteasome subunit beta [Candidatus Woesearchaeota archaeon]